jgi:hypothetical protein
MSDTGGNDIMAKPSSAKTAGTRGASASVFSLKVTLRGVRPPVWRRLLMPGSMTLRDLHDAIQTAMGWRDGHLHAFEIGDRQYGNRANTDDVADEKGLTLNGLHKSGVDRFTYTYDFGDDWEHIIVIEKTLPASEGATYPACTGGKRNCPPEDCGGAWGYAHLLEVLADPAHPDREEQIGWIGRAFDPEAFAPGDASARLAARFRRR